MTMSPEISSAEMQEIVIVTGASSGIGGATARTGPAGVPFQVLAGVRHFVVGKIAMATYGPYAGTKFALEAVSDALRREVEPLGWREACLSFLILFGA